MAIACIGPCLHAPSVDRRCGARFRLLRIVGVLVFCLAACASASRASAVAAPLRDDSVVVWEGRGRTTPIFNLAQHAFWEGRGKTKAIANIRGKVLWEGRGAQTAILSVDSNKVAWEGRGRSKALFSMDSNGVFWEGRGRTKALANLDGRVLWEGRGRTKAIANWDSDLPGEMELFATVWLVLAAR